jgi:hypothetical protein
MKNTRILDQRGASTVEFAFVGFLLFAIIFGIIEFGVLIFDKHILTQASREGARVGVVMRVPKVSDAEIENIVRNYAEQYMVTFDSSGSFRFDPPISPAEASRVGPIFGTDLVVTVKYDYNFLILSNFGLGPITLTAETHMRME